MNPNGRLAERISRILNASPAVAACLAIGIVIAVGAVDYVTGFEIFFSVFYVAAIAVAVWFVSRPFGVFISLFSIVSWLWGDSAAGAVYSRGFIPIWNAAITFGFYLVFVWLLARVKSHQKLLEETVMKRTIALRDEITERERLEKEILEVSEREQRRIGHDLHDSLCQHLTGVSFAGQVLAESLGADGIAQSADARHLVHLVEDGITLARNIARGLSPVHIQAEGLADALQGLAAMTAERARIMCSFKCDEPVLLEDIATATHFYRIAQEAINNAVRHGKPNSITIRLSTDRHETRMSIRDDGVGLPEAASSGRGMGLLIMRHRAAIIGASFSAERAAGGGTVVTCTLPHSESILEEEQDGRAES